MGLRILLLCFYLHAALAVEAPRLELNDGNKIPVVALGTGGGTAQSIDEVRNAVLYAIEAGYRHIDTAAIYQVEPQVGEGIADAIAKGIVKREDLFVTTKLWNDRHARDQVIPALKESLSRLGLEYVDLYLIHSPMSINENGEFDDTDYLETWQGMIDAKNQGLTKSIGVSNFNSSQLDRIVSIGNNDVRPAVNQIEVNPTLTQEPLVIHCKELGIAVMAYSPFGLIFQRNADAPPPRYDDPVLVKIGEKYGKTTGQVVLRYLIDRGLIITPKSTNKERIAQNIDLFDFKLTDDEIKTINKFNKNVRVITFDTSAFYVFCASAKSPFFPFHEIES